MDNFGGGGGGGEVSTSTVPLAAKPLSSLAETVYEPEALLPNVSVVCARPLLSVVPLVGLTDAVPSAGRTLNDTACPCAGLPSSWTVTVNVNASPGATAPGTSVIAMDNFGSGFGFLTVAVPLTDSVPTDAVIVYEPDASLGSVSVVCARPLLPVVALVILSDLDPASGLTLNDTA